MQNVHGRRAWGVWAGWGCPLPQGNGGQPQGLLHVPGVTTCRQPLPVVGKPIMPSLATDGHLATQRQLPLSGLRAQLREDKPLVRHQTSEESAECRQQQMNNQRWQGHGDATRHLSAWKTRQCPGRGAYSDQLPRQQRVHMHGGQGRSGD